MHLSLARHFWGVDASQGFECHEPHWREVGYEMVEGTIRFSENPEAMKRLLARGEWPWIAQVIGRDFNPGGTIDEHLVSLRKQIDEALPYSPVFFNAHSGADSWSFSEAIDFYGKALELERELGIPIAHETHRLRCFGNPWMTRDILQALPELKLTVDLSHWVCVCERLLPDLDEIIGLVARHAHHLHARVGFEEGPQVPDPRAPEWEKHLHAHEAWWDRIWAAQKERGMAVSTLCPEFGPVPYMPTIPFTNQPVADLEPICDWMAIRQSRRFAC